MLCENGERVDESREQNTLLVHKDHTQHNQRKEEAVVLGVTIVNRHQSHVHEANTKSKDRRVESDWLFGRGSGSVESAKEKESTEEEEEICHDDGRAKKKEKVARLFK